MIMIMIMIVIANRDGRSRPLYLSLTRSSHETLPCLSPSPQNKVPKVRYVISNKSYDGAPTYRSTATLLVQYRTLRVCETKTAKLREDGVADTQTTTAQLHCHYRKVLLARISSALSSIESPTSHQAHAHAPPYSG